MNEYITYKNKHKISDVLIKNTLVSCGMRGIVNNDYPIKNSDLKVIDYRSDAKCISSLYPDFTCYDPEGNLVAVEVGDLNENNKIPRISKLLENCAKVMHIYADKEYYLMHCVIHEKRVNLSQDMIILLNESEKITKKLRSLHKENLSNEEQEE